VHLPLLRRLPFLGKRGKVEYLEKNWYSYKELTKHTYRLIIASRHLDAHQFS